MNWHTIKYFSRRSYKRLYFKYLYSKFVTRNDQLKADIDRNFIINNCKVKNDNLFNKFDHLIFHNKAFQYIVRRRISPLPWFFNQFVGTETFASKIFGSTKIDGGLVCFHPYATVINAKSIGKNFTFRNGLTIGNKDDDNTKIPVIGDNVTVGANVVIIGDIKIGNNVVIGAGAVVVMDVPDNAVVAGNPAKVIKYISC